MTERDSGRYDAINDTWVDQQVRVDFAWGNIPMQPNDDRGEATLDAELDSHIIATTSYEGFPAFIQGYPYDDTKVNIEMPNFVGVLPSAITGILNSVGGTGSWSVVDTTTVGANSGNNGKVKSQSPAAGTVVNYDQGVEVVTYEYVAPTTGPISGFNRSIPPETGWSLNGNQSLMYVVGRTVKPTVGSSIVVSGSSDAAHNTSWNVLDSANNDSYNTGGTVLKVEGPSVTNATSSGGTWTYV